jgi:acyl carrier protein
MPSASATINEAILMLVQRRSPAETEIRRESALQDDLGLESLDLAELSVILEDELGKDPYSEGLVPLTVGDILTFYDA